MEPGAGPFILKVKGLRDIPLKLVGNTTLQIPSGRLERIGRTRKEIVGIVWIGPDNAARWSRPFTWTIREGRAR
jgi:hypothetical protein